MGVRMWGSRMREAARDSRLVQSSLGELGTMEKNCLLNRSGLMGSVGSKVTPLRFLGRVMTPLI